MKTSERNKQYNEYVDKIKPKSRGLTSLIWAFVVGGTICLIGQGIYIAIEQLFPNLEVDSVGAATSITLIFIAAVLTGFGVYDKIGKFAGGGSIVPITGFSNSITSPAIEFKKEGIVLGTSAKMFTIAGPVLVFGITFSMLVGLIYFIVGLF